MVCPHGSNSFTMRERIPCDATHVDHQAACQSIPAAVLSYRLHIMRSLQYRSVIEQKTYAQVCPQCFAFHDCGSVASDQVLNLTPPITPPPLTP